MILIVYYKVNTFYTIYISFIAFLLQVEPQKTIDRLILSFPSLPMNNDTLVKTIPTFLICLTIIVVGYFFAGKDITIQQMPPEQFQTLTVQWDGKVYAQPDILLYTIEITHTALTSVAANDAVKKTLVAVNEILQKNNVDMAYVQTTAMSVYPEYDYTFGRGKLTGYRASQTLSVKIKKVTTDNVDVWPRSIDALLTVAGVNVSGISYDIEDKKAVYQEARAAAIAKAKQKAQEMADGVGVDLTRAISISENNSRDNPMPYYGRGAVQTNTMEMDMSATAESKSGTIALGQLEFSSVINITYGIE